MWCRNIDTHKNILFLDIYSNTVYYSFFINFRHPQFNELFVIILALTRIPIFHSLQMAIFGDTQAFHGCKRPRFGGLSVEDEDSGATATLSRDLGELGETPQEQGMVTFQAQIRTTGLFMERKLQNADDLHNCQYPIPGTTEKSFNVVRHQPAFRCLELMMDERSKTLQISPQQPYAFNGVFGAWNNKRKDHVYICVGWFAAQFSSTPGIQQFNQSPHMVAVNAQGVGIWYNGPEFVYAGDDLYMGDPVIAKGANGVMSPHSRMEGLDPNTLLPTIRPYRIREHGHASNMVANLTSMIYDGNFIETEMYKRRWMLTTFSARMNGQGQEAVSKFLSENDKDGSTPEQIVEHLVQLGKLVEEKWERFGFSKKPTVVDGIDFVVRLKISLMIANEDQCHYDFFGRKIGRALQSAGPGQPFNIYWTC